MPFPLITKYNDIFKYLKLEIKLKFKNNLHKPEGATKAGITYSLEQVHYFAQAKEGTIMREKKIINTFLYRNKEVINKLNFLCFGNFFSISFFHCQSLLYPKFYVIHNIKLPNISH